ncbi:MAG: hypothetical protein IPJ52_14740 [Rhodocyclaceae bacterium]|nr:hypothetical protein [Rhodocyclaceae bacterium]
MVTASLGASLLTGGAAHAGPPDWGKIAKRDIQLFHPGVVSHEWVMSKSSHSGRTGLTKGESCIGCHDSKAGFDIDLRKLADKQLEPVGAPKTMIFPVTIQAAFDDEHLYMRLTFRPPADAAAEASREDAAPRHEVKAAIMFASPQVEHAAQHGCWLACHSDVRSMPGADPKKKKYVEHGDLPGGVFFDYIQWKSGEGGKGATQVDGHVATERVNKGGKALVKAEGEVNGGVYTVIFTRKLAGNHADGDLAFSPGQIIPFGIAIHADKTVWRFHHVSMGYTLGLRAPGDVSAVKQ